jgi:hypothetical protein
MFQSTRDYHEETNIDMAPCGLEHVATHSVIIIIITIIIITQIFKEQYFAFFLVECFYLFIDNSRENM